MSVRPLQEIILRIQNAICSVGFPFEKPNVGQSRCLSNSSGVRGVVMGSDPPIQAQLLLLLQDCNGSPQSTFR